MVHLPPGLCLRNKNLHCFRTCLRTPTQSAKYQVNSLRSFIKSSVEYITLVIQNRCSSFLRTVWDHGRRSRFATKTIPQGAPLPTEYSKITILHGLGCSLNLSISCYCSLVFWEYGCGVLSIGKQSIGKLCRMSGHPLLQKARTFGPPTPPNKHDRFQ